MGLSRIGVFVVICLVAMFLMCLAILYLTVQVDNKVFLLDAREVPKRGSSHGNLGCRPCQRHDE